MIICVTSYFSLILCDTYKIFRDISCWRGSGLDDAQEINPKFLCIKLQSSIFFSSNHRPMLYTAFLWISIKLNVVTPRTNGIFFTWCIALLQYKKVNAVYLLPITRKSSSVILPVQIITSITYRVQISSQCTSLSRPHVYSMGVDLANDWCVTEQR